jgi:hypothetical protein
LRRERLVDARVNSGAEALTMLLVHLGFASVTGREALEDVERILADDFRAFVHELAGESPIRGVHKVVDECCEAPFPPVFREAPVGIGELGRRETSIGLAVHDDSGQGSRERQRRGVVKFAAGQLDDLADEHRQVVLVRGLAGNRPDETRRRAPADE